MSQSNWTLAASLLINVLLLALALFLIQEGLAQSAAPETVSFFMEFPVALLPLAYAAVLLLVLNFALTALVLRRGLWRRRWPWLTTAAAALLLGVIVAELGLRDVWIIINPAAA